MVERDLEEDNGHFNHPRGEINHLKIREKELKENVEELRGFVLGAAHGAEVFKSHLDRIEDNVCKCGRTPSVVGQEFVFSEEEARTEQSYASARGSKYIAPPHSHSCSSPMPPLWFINCSSDLGRDYRGTYFHL